MSTGGSVLKRVLIGRPFASRKLEHHLLPKSLALPVFASDPLSSVAYATEEMMLVLVTAGAVALGRMIPISLAIAGLLAIVITSYRQTVRAYPRGGGSYIVARSNLGTVPGLVAAAAILTDYVLTVAVSVTAGTIAVSSAAPGIADHKVAVGAGFVALIALANLRGVREAGKLFAVPTYGFVAVVYVTLVIGLIDCLSGCPEAATAGLELRPEHGIGLFLILRAFSSGATALTGVEAIADGVQAFRRPKSRNAAATLALMGAMSASMFVGITVLARALHVRVTEEIAASQSVLAQIGETVFGDGFLFLVLQAFTAMILILAANTSFQDFPRLSAILARDGFFPRQFMNRGDRLVFSNGIVVLSLAAGLLIWVFEANLTALIQLYVVGVFTAFTLSQAGMVRRWLVERGTGWRKSAAINAVGASATGVVLVIVAITKFTRGAWIVMAAIPIIVLALLSLSRHYERVRARLRNREVAFRPDAGNRVVLVMTDIDASAAGALGFARSFRPESLHPIYVGPRPREEVEVLWEALSRGAGPVEFPEGRDEVAWIARRVRELRRDFGDFVTVLIPEEFGTRSLLRVVTRPLTFRLKFRLLREPGAVVASAPVLAERGHLVGVDGRPLIPERVVALVFVAGAHDAAVQAVNYARSLEAAETRAVYAVLDPEEHHEEVARQWLARGITMRLDIIEVPFRDLGPAILEEVRSVTRDPGAVAAVVMPELFFGRWWQRLLHNNRALFIKRLLLFEPRVVLSTVPFQMETKGE